MSQVIGCCLSGHSHYSHTYSVNRIYRHLNLNFSLTSVLLLLIFVIMYNPLFSDLIVFLCDYFFQ